MVIYESHLLGNSSIRKAWKETINSIQLLVSNLIFLTCSAIWLVFRAHQLGSCSRLLPESVCLCADCKGSLGRPAASLVAWIYTMQLSSSWSQRKDWFQFAWQYVCLQMLTCPTDDIKITDVATIARKFFPKAIRNSGDCRYACNKKSVATILFISSQNKSKL